MAIHVCAYLVLQAVKHEAHNGITSIENGWDDEDENQHDDPKTVFVWSLLKNSSKAA